jgi:hypothetical protein
MGHSAGWMANIGVHVAPACPPKPSNPRAGRGRAISPDCQALAIDSLPNHLQLLQRHLQQPTVNSTEAERRACQKVKIPGRVKWLLPLPRGDEQHPIIRAERACSGSNRPAISNSLLSSRPRRFRLPHDASFSWDFAGRRPIQTGQEAYRTRAPGPGSARMM